MHKYLLGGLISLIILATNCVSCTSAALTPALHVPILMYHYISANPLAPADPVRTRLSVPPKDFAQQLAYLHRAGYTSITLDDLLAAFSEQRPLPPKPIILTFDDGYADFYTNAFPLLQQYGDKATIYIISGKVDTPGYLSWQDLRELAQSPLITIGAHTRTHPELPKLSAARSWDELDGSKSDLEQQLGIRVRHLAYPSGHYTATTLAQALQIGFDTAVTTEPGMSERADKLLLLPRIRVHGGAPLADLVAGLQGRRALSLDSDRAAPQPDPSRMPLFSPY